MELTRFPVAADVLADLLEARELTPLATTINTGPRATSPRIGQVSRCGVAKLDLERMGSSRDQTFTTAAAGYTINFTKGGLE